jgi:hypothetical protein
VVNEGTIPNFQTGTALETSTIPNFLKGADLETSTIPNFLKGADLETRTRRGLDTFLHHQKTEHFIPFFSLGTKKKINLIFLF